MANPQKENGYTAIANELLDELCKTSLTGVEFSVVLFILRKTYGWGKKQDKISISQIVKIVGKSKRTVIYTLQNLESKKILNIQRSTSNGKKDSNLISLNKNYDTWIVQNFAPQVKKNRELAKISSAKLRNQVKNEVSSAKLGKLVVQNSAKKVNSFAHTKETIQKKVTKETSKTEVLHGKEIALLIDSFKTINPSYRKWFGNKTQRASCERLIETHGMETLQKIINLLPKTNQTEYMPVITTPVQLEDKFAQLATALQKLKNKQPIIL
jgi:phage replication O-like protein O